MWAWWTSCRPEVEDQIWSTFAVRAPQLWNDVPEEKRLTESTSVNPLWQTSLNVKSPFLNSCVSLCSWSIDPSLMWCCLLLVLYWWLFNSGSLSALHFVIFPVSLRLFLLLVMIWFDTLCLNSSSDWAFLFGSSVSAVIFSCFINSVFKGAP